jgi:hypothetical protein
MHNCTTCNSRSSSAEHQKQILPGLDFLQPVFRIGSGFSQVSLVPVCYLYFLQVSGEYAMLHHGAAAGAFDLRNTLTEVLTSMRRYPSGIRIQFDSGIFLDWSDIENLSGLDVFTCFKGCLLPRFIR